MTPFVAPTSNNQSLERFAKRDLVLQTLLSRSEGTARKSATQTTNSWISKYAFSKETVQAADELEAKAQPNKVKSSSPKKKKESDAAATKHATRTSSRKSDAPRKGASLIEENGRDKVTPAIISDSTGRQDASPTQGRIPRKTETPGSSRQIANNRETSGSDRHSRRKSAPVGLPEHNPQRGGVKEEESSQASGKPAPRQNRKSLPAQSSSMNETTAVGKKRKSLRSLKPSAMKISKFTSVVKVHSKDPETIDLCLGSDSD